MRFLVDECTGPLLARRLRDLNHDVLSIYEEHRGLDDGEILKMAEAENRIIVTNDKDFGEMIFREGKPHKGVILLRLKDERTANKIRKIEWLLELHAERIPGNFVVATETTVRIVARK